MLISFSLRPASLADCELTLAWANDPVTRAMSFASTPIAAADHASWFARSLTGKTRRLFIAQHGQEPVGLLRLDFVDEGHKEAEVGINLAPEARGRGLALPALNALVSEARSLSLEKLVARVKPENQPSRRAFERAGFVLCESQSEGSPLRFELALGVSST